MAWNLRRESDGAGDTGPLLQIMKIESGEVSYSDIPTDLKDLPLDHFVRVGAITARSYSYQDYWTTTPITEILESDQNSVRFKTRNSIYKLEVI